MSRTFSTFRGSSKFSQPLSKRIFVSQSRCQIGSSLLGWVMAA